MKLFRRTPSIRPADLRDALDRGATVIDVRTSQEWAAGHLPQSRHIPLEELAGRLDELRPDVPAVIVCRSGNRSAVAAAALARRGFEVANLVGGLTACSRDGIALVRDDGRPGHVA